MNIQEIQDRIGKRVIQFRAWDKTRKLMVRSEYPDNWEYIRDEYYGDWVKTKLTSIENISSNDNFTVMQYTNLKDKNGKKIFSGDIVKKEGRIGVVVMHAGCWCIQISENEYVGFSANSNGNEGSCEVIGNVFDHPEILSPSQ